MNEPDTTVSLTEQVEVLRSALASARQAMEPFRQVAHIYRDRKPQHGDVIQAWEFSSGSAELRVSHCERAQAVCQWIDDLDKPNGASAPRVAANS